VPLARPGAPQANKAAARAAAKGGKGAGGAAAAAAAAGGGDTTSARRFVSPGGFTVLVGRNTRQNDALSTQVGRGGASTTFMNRTSWQARGPERGTSAGTVRIGAARVGMPGCEPRAGGLPCPDPPCPARPAQIAADDDLWLHVRGMPGSHVVLRVGSAQAGGGKREPGEGRGGCTGVPC
jgi:hypothetical protein